VRAKKKKGGRGMRCIGKMNEKMKYIYIYEFLILECPSTFSASAAACFLNLSTGVVFENFFRARSAGTDISGKLIELDAMERDSPDQKKKKIKKN
jgi:hypothetical protein